ncbi:hypothetical protein GOBAR_DD08713 [Gossypium barbadense]|nr:hypothetical protein GOBAR_DD08713 [Gossypium barbadense]
MAAPLKHVYSFLDLNGIRPSNATVQVEAKNVATIARLEGAASGGHAQKEQRGLAKSAQGVHRGLQVVFAIIGGEE